jgi:Mg2+/Co2+ transporter CorC
MSPFTNLLNKSSEVVLRLFGQKAANPEENVHSPEELRMLIEQSQEGGVLQAQDADILEGVFEFSEKNAREVMTPRTDIDALPIEATLDETIALVEESGRSRYPVFEETIDNIVGIVLAKDLIPILRAPPPDFSLRAILRPVHVVPGSREVEEVLSDFKRLKEHLAIVLDEYGGTAGLVTMEDLLEEIVGEILDEYDEPPEHPNAKAPISSSCRAARTSVSSTSASDSTCPTTTTRPSAGSFLARSGGSRLLAIGRRPAGRCSRCARWMDGEWSRWRLICIRPAIGGRRCESRLRQTAQRRCRLWSAAAADGWLAARGGAPGLRLFGCRRRLAADADGVGTAACEMGRSRRERPHVTTVRDDRLPQTRSLEAFVRALRSRRGAGGPTRVTTPSQQA